MKTHLLNLVNSLSQLDHTDKNLVEKLKKHILTTTLYTKKENPEVHICAFFLPIVKKERLVFMGHHIKADDWIPPGGHMEPGETALQTINREMEEELRYTLTDEKVELFDIAIKDINNPKQKCKRHYDFVYLVYVDQPYDFIFDKKEFHDAKWVSFEEAAENIKSEAFQQMMNHLRDLR